jgi:hypothetical protein
MYFSSSISSNSTGSSSSFSNSYLSLLTCFTVFWISINIHYYTIVPSLITLIYNKKEYHIRTNFGLPTLYPSMLYLLNLESREQLDLEHQEV